MSALRQPDFAPQSYLQKPQFKPQKNYNQQPSKRNHREARKVIKSQTFPQQNRLPQNLQLLSLLQKGSFGLALVSLAASMGLYISTVKIPELWSQEYRNLENLQRQERELTAINEKIKYQIAHEASKDNRLSISKPESAIFIPPAKTKLKHDLENSLKHPPTAKVKHIGLGY